MLSNGFLQILDLKIISLPRFLRFGWPAHRHINRVVAQSTGSWNLFVSDGRCLDARLVSSWVLANGLLLGLRWQTADGRCFAAVTSIRLQAPITGRRLLTRLRWPLFESATVA
ncbi:MAG: hypothetical protein QF483_08485 [Gammaproteobacteria bacterium]|nr:hypothetical protein [Gammaproteobacteria bacterium]MDP7296197.1 hypothetical protein [Gammaproteobacteria bacterium]MDP7419907.1 hypothetical protein [Gammaproteobacteria bacterium]MDP7659792.1 hypothetical protein [Gammaproteobacteria bacterium]HJP39142.1 hypothetical protein [Gammaproteobacteria bacterium]